MKIDKDNKQLLEQVEGLEECIKTINEDGELYLSKDMFCKESDFYESLDELKKHVKAEITYLENKIKNNLYDKMKEGKQNK